MKKLLILLTVWMGLSPQFVFANESLRVDQLENKVKALTERLDTLEKSIQGLKKGGFTLVAIVNCTLKTPVGETYEAAELTKTAAYNSVLEACKAKASDKTSCNDNYIKCR